MTLMDNFTHLIQTLRRCETHFPDDAEQFVIVRRAVELVSDEFEAAIMPWSSVTDPERVVSLRIVARFLSETMIQFQSLSITAARLAAEAGKDASDSLAAHTIFNTEADVLIQLQRGVANAIGLNVDDIGDHQPVPIVWPVVESLLQTPTTPAA